MEEKINIAEILRHKSHGIKLYSPIFGECTFCYVREDTNDICVKKYNGVIEYFNSEGLYFTLGEVMLFPSKEMRNWRKFIWKKGDLLINSCGFQCIFKEWSSDDYTKFNGCYSNSRDGYEDVPNAETANFVKLDDNTAYKYVKEIERKLGGKLNLKTLEVEKAQPEFKDGDILVAEEDNYYDKVIFIAAIKDAIVSKALINIRYEDYEVHYNEYRFGHNRSLRLATEEESQQLFSALAKEGKAWDVEKKKIIALKKKWTPKPFDRVITRNTDDDTWTANIFSHMDSHGEYVTIGCVGGYTYCVPYNEETAKLVGTKNNVGK